MPLSLAIAEISSPSHLSLRTITFVRWQIAGRTGERLACWHLCCLVAWNRALGPHTAAVSAAELSQRSSRRAAAIAFATFPTDTEAISAPESFADRPCRLCRRPHRLRMRRNLSRVTARPATASIGCSLLARVRYLIACGGLKKGAEAVSIGRHWHGHLHARGLSAPLHGDSSP